MNDFVLGSVLFAMQHLGARLVVVIGHSRCSVVAQAVQRWARKKALDREKNPTVRTLAEGVQETLGSHGPTPPSQQTPPASVRPPRLKHGTDNLCSSLDCLTPRVPCSGVSLV